MFSFKNEKTEKKPYEFISSAISSNLLREVDSFEEFKKRVLDEAKLNIIEILHTENKLIAVDDHHKKHRNGLLINTETEKMIGVGENGDRVFEDLEEILKLKYNTFIMARGILPEHVKFSYHISNKMIAANERLAKPYRLNRIGQDTVHQFVDFVNSIDVSLIPDLILVTLSKNIKHIEIPRNVIMDLANIEINPLDGEEYYMLTPSAQRWFRDAKREFEEYDQIVGSKLKILEGGFK